MFGVEKEAARVVHMYRKVTAMRESASVGKQS
jgi:hypothetical protein